MASVEERLWAKIEKTDAGCWNWLAGKSSDGYGRFSVAGRTCNAHRVVYELLVGEVPPGKQIDHLCRNRACVNPAHLDVVVSPGENTRRGLSPLVSGSHQRVKTHCPHGHPYDEANTYVQPKGGRVCRTCRSAYGRAWWARKRAERLAAQKS